MNHGIDQGTHGSTGADTESPSITDILGSKAVLPGESIDEYKKARRLIIQELVAKSPLQLYLAEKMLDGLWWMRRYEEQKRFVIADAMVDFIVGRLSGKVTDEKRAELTQVVLNDALSPWLAEILSKKDLTVNADVKLTRVAEVKLTHLGEDGGFGTAYVDPGAVRGDSGVVSARQEHQRDCQGAWGVAQHGARAPA